MEVLIKELKDRVDSNICLMPKDIFDALKLSTDNLYKIHLGQSYGYSYLAPNQGPDKCMYFPVSVFKTLVLLEGITLNIWAKEDEVYLGPVVGVFLNPRGIEAIRMGAPSFCTQKHAEAGSITNCLAYHYSFEGINWDEGKIKGYTFVSSLNKWICGWFPMPDVLYDRGINFNRYQGPYVTYMKERFRANNVHFINSQRYLDKWEVYECLSKYPDIRTYLPKTIIYRSFDDVLSMLNEFKFIFVKASTGTQGTDVLSIEQTDKEYKLNFYEDGLKEIILKEIEDVKRFVEEYAVGRPYIVQQGIRLIKYNGRNLDIRLLMVKGRQGNWDVCEQHHCRVAQKTYTITNCSLGGEWVDYEEVHPHLESTFCKRSVPDQEELVNATREILNYYEKEFGSFGELGIDMAVDIYGDIWFIEANTRPQKLTDPSLHAPGEIPASAINIFEYARFLTGN